MRDIKFRAWDAYENRMWYSHENNTTFLSKNGEEVTFYFCFNPKTGNMEAVTESFPYLVTDDPFNIYDTEKHYHDVMQYTGTKDKNGKEIYEGDVVIYPQYYFNDHLMSSGMEVIEWEGPGFNEVLWAGHGNCPAYVEVVGNIYENPELLKEAKE